MMLPHRMSAFERCGAVAPLMIVPCAVVAGLIALSTANAIEVEGPYDWYEVLLDVDRVNEIDPRVAAHLLAFAEMGRDRCEFSPFPAWTLVNRCARRLSDFRVTVEAVEVGRHGAIGQHFQLMLDAEDEVKRLFAARGQEEGCRIVRNEVGRHVRLD